jgi:hypothetical protein
MRVRYLRSLFFFFFFLIVSHSILRPFLTGFSFGDWRHDIPDPSVADGIPWPALTQAAPSKLTRTASNLMAEWERSLSPSPVASPSLGKDSKKD